MTREDKIEQILSEIKRRIFEETTAQNINGQNLDRVIVPNVDWIFGWWNNFNQNVFNNFLKRPKFSTNCQTNEFGRYVANVGMFKYKNTPGELSINGRYKRKEREWLGTLLHEMCHQYVAQKRGSRFQDVHGRDFNAILGKVNSNQYVKSLGVVALKVDKGEVTNADGNEEYALYQNEYGNNTYLQGQGRMILGVITNVNNNPYWAFLLTQNQLETAKQTLNKYHVQNCAFYYVNSEKLTRAKTDPQRLIGFGGNTFKAAVSRMGFFYGEFDYNVFRNLTPIK